MTGTPHHHPAEATRWSRLAALLPSAQDVDEVQACWDIGEQEAGLTMLVDRIRALGLPLADAARAELAVMAERWGVWEPLGAAVADCPPPPGRAIRLRVLPDGAAEPRPAHTVLPDPPAPGLLLVPWLVCTACDRTLARGHDREPWGGLSYLPLCYVVFGPGGDPKGYAGADPAAAWRALEALCGCG
jgi:hypothetical protein